MKLDGGGLGEGICKGGFGATSRLQIHPKQQVLEARVVAEGVDSQDLLRDATKHL